MADASQQGDLSIGLTVNDIEKSLRLYTEGLGFTPGERYEKDGTLQGVMMTLGATTLGLSQDDFAKGRDRVKGVGMSLYIGTKEDIAAAAARARKAGLTLSGEPAPMPWGPMGFTITDPDGFKITVANPG